ncbi:DUF5996 family protein [Massilia sp. R2A-15]|uniref:DUF5996 family protein n=1 Tax=Massilia sp. R2A-15 TaxID=3064278 RepID=UPI00273254B9|nr:DUF5996 family protein [Massilia sp. R2A-15]WLI91373.1 DUF5996 family protein [Massilia sp. R2A-15]
MTPIWPELQYNDWKDTCATLHRWCQIVGKIRLRQSPWLNHSWHATFYVTARGITTSAIPYNDRSFDIEFDFIDHRVHIRVSDGMTRTLELRPRSVADFYRELFAHMNDLGLTVQIHGAPNEVPGPIPFTQDETHAAYDPEYSGRYWRLLVQADRVMKQFRARFIGKCSPVHLFWGSFDLAVTRFSGASAPEHPGGVPNCPDWVTREAYSQEVSSSGFWPGSDALPMSLFYAYAYPAPPGFKNVKVRPDKAYYEETFGEFVLPYDEVRLAASPDAMLLEFLQSTYEAAADLGRWNRPALEQHR